MRREMYLERLLAILEVVSEGEPSRDMSVSDIVQVTGLPKPTVYRQVGDLVDAGLLEPAENGRYAIGVRTKRLSGQYAADRAVRDLAVPLLKSAAHTHGTTFFLSQLNGTAVEIIQAEVPDTGVSYLHPGIGSRPLHACSCAKAISAFSQNPRLHQAMAGRLKAYTAHTKTALGDLQAEFESIRNIGFAECVEELENGVCSVAAPVLTDGGDVSYSMGATGTTRVFPPQIRARMGRVAMELCAELGALVQDAQGSSAAMR